MLSDFYSTTTYMYRYGFINHFHKHLQEYLQGFPLYHDIDIETDPRLESSRKARATVVTSYVAQDMDCFGRKKQQQPISQEDLDKLYDSRVLSNDHPIALQNKVWVEIMIYIGGLGRLTLRGLEKQNFVFERDDQDRLYFRLEVPTLTEEQKAIRVYEQKDNPRCPLQSLCLYLSKLNARSSTFFQQPLREPSANTWYSHRPIGKNAHSTWLATLCREAGVSTPYCNRALYFRRAPMMKVYPGGLGLPWISQ